MASAWGSAWGEAWGASWGSFTAVQRPTEGGHGGRKKRGKDRDAYDRPVLAEYAEALRDALKANEPARAKEFARKIVKEGRAQPIFVPELAPMVDVATRLRDLKKLELGIMLDLSRRLVVQARAVEAALRDEEDAILLLG